MTAVSALLVDGLAGGGGQGYGNEMLLKHN